MAEVAADFRSRRLSIGDEQSGQRQVGAVYDLPYASSQGVWVRFGVAFPGIQTVRFVVIVFQIHSLFPLVLFLSGRSFVWGLTFESPWGIISVFSGMNLLALKLHKRYKRFTFYVAHTNHHFSQLGSMRLFLFLLLDFSLLFRLFAYLLS